MIFCYLVLPPNGHVRCRAGEVAGSRDALAQPVIRLTGVEIFVECEELKALKWLSELSPFRVLVTISEVRRCCVPAVLCLAA